MFGIGMTEMLVIAVIALIFIGPDQLPEVARAVGRFMNDIRRSTDDLKRDFHQQTGVPRNLNDWFEEPQDPRFIQAPQHPPEPAKLSAEEPVASEETAENKIDSRDKKS